MKKLILAALLAINSFAQITFLPPAPGGAVGGASSLTTVGAIPYVTSAGVLGQDAGLNWDSTNDKLTISSTTGFIVQEISSNSGTGTYFRMTKTSGSTRSWDLGATGSGNAIGDNSFGLYDNTAAAYRYMIRSTGNFLIGGTLYTDGNYKLDIQSSGSTGTLRVWDQSGAGSTLAVFRGGAAQSGSVLKIQNNAGSDTVTVSEGGLINTAASGGFTTSGDTSIYYYSTYARLMSASTFQIQWRDGATWYGGSIDSGISRNTAGVIESNNGSATVLRDFLARQYKNTPVAVASLQTCNAGNKGSLASVSDALAPAWGATVANGGAAYAQVTCNGTNWTVTGI